VGLPFREPVPLWPFKWLGQLSRGKALTDALFNVGFAHSSMKAIFGDAGILCQGHDAALLVAFPAALTGRNSDTNEHLLRSHSAIYKPPPTPSDEL
jgi:hypothetical protein